MKFHHMTIMLFLCAVWAGMVVFNVTAKAEDAVNSDPKSLLSDFSFTDSPIISDQKIPEPDFSFKDRPILPRPGELKIDGKKYSLDLVKRDFMRAAISSTLWGNYVVSSGHEGPWWQRAKHDYAPYFSYENGYPKQIALHKWSRDFTIGFVDWSDLPQAYKNHVLSLIPVMEKLTGLSVNFVTAPSENKPDIRIYSFTKNAMASYFKYRFSHPHWQVVEVFSGHWTLDPFEFEDQLVAAIPFTPRARSQLDGYFLPESDNTITRAVCKISTQIPEELGLALISECLFRSLGIPEPVIEGRSFTDAIPRIYNISNTLLGNWNRAYDAYTALDYWDGIDAYCAHVGKDDRPACNAEKGFADIPVKNAQIIKWPTDYDKLLVSLLYCPDLKPGMDQYETLSVMKNNDCFKKQFDSLDAVKLFEEEQKKSKKP